MRNGETLMGRGNDGSGYSMPVYPRGPATPQKRRGKKGKWTKIEKEARQRKLAGEIAESEVRNAERALALSQKPRLIKKGQPDWKPPKRPLP